MGAAGDRVTASNGLPAALKISAAAQVLGLPERTVRHWVEVGELETAQVRPGAARYVPVAALARLAEHMGLEPDWALALPPNE